MVTPVGRELKSFPSSQHGAPTREDHHSAFPSGGAPQPLCTARGQAFLYPAQAEAGGVAWWSSTRLAGARLGFHSQH
jgi:hypothetical protein